MSDDFNYEEAWHLLAGWLERTAADHLSPAGVNDLIAGYTAAVRHGSRYGQ